MEQETSSCSSSSSDSSSRKRSREPEDRAEEGAEVESSKRLCKQNQELQSILEEAECLDECQQGLVSDVMRSLEEELGVMAAADDSCCRDQERPPSAHLDIGYLLEASDDELGISPAEQPALVEAEDLLRAESCESWGKSDDWGGDDFSGEACFMDEIGGQEWLRRTLEMFLSSRTAAAAAAAATPSVTALVLGPGFEPAAAQAGLIL